MRYKRQVRTKEEIRGILEKHQQFVPINNRIFDDLYEKDKIVYRLILEKENRYSDPIETTFTDLDMIIYIFLGFLQRCAITLYPKEIANYLQCSEKQFNASIQKMRGIQVEANNRQYGEKFSITDRKPMLISEKNETAFENGKHTKAKVWYPNFNADIAEKDGEVRKVNFFHLTIYDFDLLTERKLTRKEFILYVFLIRLDTDNNKHFYIKYSTIGERLKIKGLDTTLSGYIEKLKSFGLIEINLPQNYDRKVLSRQEPSYELIPIFNRQKLREMREQKVEVSHEDGEMDDKIEEDNVDFEELEFPF